MSHSILRSYRSVLSLVALSSFVSVTSYAENSVFGEVGLGAGATVSHNTAEGTAGGGDAVLRGAGMGLGGRHEPLGSAEGEVRYNMIGGSKAGVSTGLAASGSAFVGGTFLDSYSSCDIYAGGGLSFDVQAHLGRKAGNMGRVAGGPETGLICQLGDVLFMVSPTVSLGYMENNSGVKSNLNIVNVGARARLGVKDKLMLTGEILTTPKFDLASKEAPEWLTTHARLTADVKLGDKWVAGAYLKVLAAEDERRVDPKFVSVEGGLRALRAF